MLAGGAAEIMSGWSLNGYHICKMLWELDLNKFLSWDTWVQRVAPIYDFCSSFITPNQFVILLLLFLMQTHISKAKAGYENLKIDFQKGNA